MTTPVAYWLLGFLTGGFFGFRSGWLLRRGGASKSSLGPRQPEQPLAADVIRYARWRDEQIERALRGEPPTPNMRDSATLHGIVNKQENKS